MNDAVSYATRGQLDNLELKRDDKNSADIAVFDFTSIKKAENSARIIERKGHKLLLGLVGDSLLEVSRFFVGEKVVLIQETQTLLTPSVRIN